MPVQISESLQRRIGPLPAWGWGAAIGGGLLAVRMLRGGSFLGTRDTGEPLRNEIGDPTNQPQTPPPITGPAGPAGKDAPTAPQRPACPNPGWGWNFNPNSNNWEKQYSNPFPSYLGTGGRWIAAWDTLTCAWVPRLQDQGKIAPSPKATVVADPGARGPVTMARDLGGIPTQTLGDFYDTPHLAPPDPTPKSKTATMRRISFPRVPTIVGMPSNNTSGTRLPFGRPFHRGN